MKRKSAILPYRKTKNGLEFLLVRNMDDNKWVIPKGTIEHPLPPALSAAMEAFEEAGVVGRTLPPRIGKYYKNGQWVSTYLLKVERVLHKYDEAAFRERKWVQEHSIHNHVFDFDLLQVIKSGIKVITKKSAFFKKMIKSFAADHNVEVVVSDKASAILSYSGAEDHRHLAYIQRFGKTLEFYVPSKLHFQSSRKILKVDLLNKMLENNENKIGFWAIREQDGRFEFGRIHNIEMRLLDSTLFYKTLKVLITDCDCFEITANKKIVATPAPGDSHEMVIPTN